MIDQSIPTGALDIDGRREFIARATGDVARLAAQSQSSVTIDCSAVDPVDAQIVGMLVVIARTAARHGIRVQLAEPTVRLRQHLDLSGVTHMFDYH